MFSLPDPVAVPDADDDDTDWAAMLTMPLEDMNMKVDSLGMPGTSSSGSSHWAHHHSQHPTQSSSDFHFGSSPPMTASDVYGTSQGRSQFQPQQHSYQSSSTINRSVHMYGDASSYRTDSRRAYLDTPSAVSFGSSAPHSRSAVPSRSDWGGNTGVNGSDGRSSAGIGGGMQQQQAYYRGPAHSMQYYRPYQQQQQQSHQQAYPARSSSQHLPYSGDGYPPLSQDDFGQSLLADSLDWSAEWSGSSSEQRQGTKNSSMGNKR
jgi:hypothetical protein